METQIPCFSLGLDSPSNRSGNHSPALLLNLFWRSDIIQFPTSTTQTDGFSALMGVDGTQKSFRRLGGLNYMPFLQSYQGNTIITIWSYDEHKQSLSSAILSKYIKENKKKIINACPKQHSSHCVIGILRIAFLHDSLYWVNYAWLQIIF